VIRAYWVLEKEMIPIPIPIVKILSPNEDAENLITLAMTTNLTRFL